MSKTLRNLALALAASASLAACVDAPTEMSSARTTQPRLEFFDPAIEVDVLQRTAPLPADLTASAVITRKAGGVISIPAAGFSIEFPANAVKGGQPTTITVRALAGTNVAYVFEPHGLVFDNNPMITQDLKVTAAFGNPALRDYLEGAYFPDLTYLDGTKAHVKETRPTVVDVNGWKMKFNVQHFSGYLASSGRGGYISSSGNRLER